MAASNRTNVRQKEIVTPTRTLVFKLVIFVFLSTTLLSSSGCLSFAANVIRVIKGTDTPAEFDEFKEKKVAVVVSTSAGLNADASGIIMANHVHALLATHVKKIQMVNQEEISRIISDLPANEQGMSLIGSRVGADYVVAIDVANLKLRDGPTLYKGTSTTNVTVHNVSEGGSPVFRKAFPDFVFPSMGVPVTDSDEATFQRFYLSEIAQRVGRIFYPYDPSIDVAKDASSASIQSFR